MRERIISLSEPSSCKSFSLPHPSLRATFSRGEKETLVRQHFHDATFFELPPPFC